MNRIAVLKIRGNINARQTVVDTMNMLHLRQVNHCVVIDDRAIYKGMIQKAKDYITWGLISPETFTHMLTKRGEVDDALVKKNTKYKTVTEYVKAFFAGEAQIADLKINPVFRLSPPRKGYENTKAPFSAKGSLGNRGDKINAILERMI